MYDHTFQARILSLLTSGIASAVNSVYNNRVYYNVAPSNPTFPLLIYQQGLFGRKNDSINQNGWRGVFIFRSIDTTLSGANNKLIETAGALQNITLSGEYTISIVPSSPVSFPVEKLSATNIYTSAMMVDVAIYKS